MFRKNLTLKVEKKLEFKDDVFIYTITDIYFEKVKNIRDIGEDGIVFDVPDVSFDDIAGHDKVKKKIKRNSKIIKKSKSPCKTWNRFAKRNAALRTSGNW